MSQTVSEIMWGLNLRAIAAKYLAAVGTKGAPVTRAVRALRRLRESRTRVALRDGGLAVAVGGSLLRLFP